MQHMKINQYNDLFSDWSDVSKEFTKHRWGEEDKARLAIPEPDEVIFANYVYENYAGDAFVLYRIGDRYFINEGSHCSCYGLEGQWAPDEYDLVTVIAALEKRGCSDYEGSAITSRQRDALVAILRARVSEAA